jgi:phenylacetate-CoA ligase
MIHKAKSYLLKNITRLPRNVSHGVMLLNRNPDLVFGKGYREYRDFLSRNTRLFDNRSILLNSVNGAIREIPYYRMRYGDRTIQSIEEFEETIPFIDKDKILENYDHFINPDISLADYDKGTTGGTSGKPLTFIAPKNRFVVELATMHSLWERAGYRFDVRAVIRNHRLHKGTDYLINPLTREVIFDGFNLTDNHFAMISRTIDRMGIRFIHCYPSTAYEFSLFLRKQSHIPRITAFLSGSENIFDYQRNLIQGELGIRFYNWYGHSEKLVLAGYCRGTDHYHAEPTYGYFELVDDNGRVVGEPGKTGEIVGTSFHNPGMPFIRYRTGDYAEYVSDFCSSCGRRLPVIRNIRGRWSGDRVYNADGTFVTTTALNLHNDLYQVINGMQYLQERKGELTVLIVKSPAYNSGHEASLYAHFRGKLHRETVVTIQYVDRLQRKPNGKFVHIISSIDREVAANTHG